MYILRYLKVVVFNRRIYCSWSEIKLGKSIVYFSPICWGDSTFKRGCLFCFSITTSNMLEFTPSFFGHVGKTTKNRWALEVIFRMPWTFRVWISQWCRECGPQKETHLPTPLFFRCYFSFRVSVRHYLWIWFLHLQLFLPGFFQPYPPKIPAQVEEKAENIQLPPVPQGRNWRNWWIFGSPDRWKLVQNPKRSRNPPGVRNIPVPGL